MAHTPKNQSEKAILTARRAWCYLVLVLISFLCLFFFYVLIINSTRTHFEIQKGFSLMPGKSIITNFRNVLTDANIPVVSGIRNSLLVSACSAALSVYFSALTAYGIYAYNFKFKKAAFALILLIMTMPTQVSALGFLQLISKMGLKNSFIPLIVPSIAAPTVFFFMKQYLDASLPMEIVEAARIDGAGEFYTFNKIVLPIMKPALAVQAIFSFVASWNNYFIPALVLDTADIKLPGVHNIENYMAAVAAVDGMVPDEAIRAFARTFGGVEHRIELVRELDGVRWYNDSIASSPSRTIAGLRSFPEKVLLIAGGKDKGISYDAIGPEINEHVKALILCGATAGVIRAAVEKAANFTGLPITEVDSYPAAVELARETAQPGDVVLLSPASTSFDRFANFMERGKVFKDLVNALK